MYLRINLVIHEFTNVHGILVQFLLAQTHDLQNHDPLGRLRSQEMRGMGCCLTFLHEHEELAEDLNTWIMWIFHQQFSKMQYYDVLCTFLNMSTKSSSTY